MITGRQARNAPVSATIDPKTINLYFQSINIDDQYSSPEVLSIPDGTRIPTIEVHTVWKFLSTLKRTAPGPDELPFWIWRDYAYQLAPTITKVFNSSLKKQLVPYLWKLANITPIPKETTFETCNQLRPISLTNVIMRLFERVVVKQELSPALGSSAIGPDQFAYKEGCNTTLALLTCQHHWLKWLDGAMDFVRVFSFDFSKAFDSVPHAIVCNKLMSLNINPYVINWIVSFLSNRKQRVVVDGFVTEFVSINRGVPQGTVLGPILFSIMVNDIRPVYPERNLLLKYADDLTLSVPVSAHQDHSLIEVNSIQHWAVRNRMKLNLTKTWEMVVHGRISKPLPPMVQGIERKSWLKLLGIIFQENPSDWDLHVDNLLRRASSRLYILRVCKHFGYPKEQLTKLFDLLIMSLFLYGIEIWGAAYQGKYLDRIDRFFKRAFKFGYTNNLYVIAEVIRDRDCKLWSTITDTPSHPLYQLLPPKKQRFLRNRGHDFIFPVVKTERFKRSFINRCLFNFI